MHEWGFSIKMPRMKSNKSDPIEQASFIEVIFPAKIKELAEKAHAQKLKLKTLFTDECCIRRDGTLHAGWYKKGKYVPEIEESNGRFETIKLLGAVDAIEGSFHLSKAAGRITTEEYSRFLIGLSQEHKDCLLLIVQDSAPWHGKKKLPALLEQAGITNIELLNLPKYSPAMNPCEKLWKWMRETVTHCRYYESLEQVLASIWRFYRRAYNNRQKAKIRFKTEINLFKYVKANGIDFDAYGTNVA